METIKFAAFNDLELTDPKSLPNPIRRKRSMTTMNPQWLGERVRKARKIKEMIEAGNYKVSSEEVAKALIGQR